MVAVAVGWDIYERTQSPLYLGLVGLVQVVPVVLLSIFSGSVIDRVPRRTIALRTSLCAFIGQFILAWCAANQAPLWTLYVILTGLGIVTAFQSPAVSSLTPAMVAAPLRSRANALSSSGYELSSMAGPALAGMLIAGFDSAAPVYALACMITLPFVAMLASLQVGRTAATAAHTAASLADRMTGVRFIFASPRLLPALTLDMFAVLFAGATALLPMFAKDVLHVGPSGLGWLRAAPAVGAFAMAVIGSRLPPWPRPGRVLLWVVAGFGVASTVFGLSTSFPLSFAALLIAGGLDNVSVVIRLTLEQNLVPDEIRGRVSAVHYVFIGLSNELGEFESGIAAALLGPMWAVAAGGLVTLGVVGFIAVRFPALRDMPPLDSLQPEPYGASS